MKDRNVSIIFTVVIATTGNRRDLLERALQSVKSQTIAPQHVVLVVDNPNADTQSWAQAFQHLGLPLTVLANRRTPGASGAWNQAMHALDPICDLRHTFVSILDDDDWWEPSYLARVAAITDHADVIATAFWRHDGESPAGRVIQPPAALRAREFLVSNPGIQGSNLTLKLKTWLQVGGFDEALRSCTDRDICIRLADLGARLRVQPEPTCHHDTLHGLERLTDKGSSAKLAGLNSFFAKYQRRMKDDERSEFAKRAMALFGWVPPVQAKSARPQQRRAPATGRTLKLAVGVIVDGDAPHKAMRLLADLERLAAIPQVGRLDVVLLENADPAGFAQVVDHAGGKGLMVWPVPVAAQVQVAVDCGLPVDLPRKKSIAESRTLLHRFVAATSRLGEDTVAWILDDDMRLPKNLQLLVSDIQRARDAGHAVVIGTAMGDPPIPVAGAIRTQLVDLVHFLAGACVRDPREQLPPGEQVNAAWMSERRDYYHDHPRTETDRLETPFMPVCEAPDLQRTLLEVGNRALRILAGEQLFRPLQHFDGDPLARTQPTTLRGGNTLVFDLDLLRRAPNLSPRLGGRFVRRSDTLWAAHARYRLGKDVVGMPIALHHDRSDDAPKPLDFATWADDILGHAFARAYEDVLGRKADATLALTIDEKQQVCAKTRQFAEERLALCRTGAQRILGLGLAMGRILDQAPSWWTAEPNLIQAVANLRELGRRVQADFADGALAQLGEQVRQRLDDDGAMRYLDLADAQLSASAKEAPAALEDWTRETRYQRAVRIVGRRLNQNVAELLGMGAEGVVVRVAGRAIKLFDRWSRTTRTEHLPTLRKLLDVPVPAALPKLAAVHEFGECVAIDMELLRGEDYTGGHGPELLALLRALREAGWVHSNVHPKNLMRTAAGLRLVDLGKSLEPHSESGQAAMVRRAWLSWRFADRPNLNDLMRKAIDETDFAELTGWQVLHSAVTLTSAKLRLDEMLESLVRQRQPTAMLDYGCGKPRNVHRLLRADQLAVFDIEPDLHLKWARELPDVEFLDSTDLEQKMAEGHVFQQVLCSLVLCAVPDEMAVTVLQNVRKLLPADGEALVSICEPTALHTPETDYQCRHCPPHAAYGRHFAYQKTVRASNRQRVDFHRPLSWYRRAFAKADLELVAEEMIDGLDVQRFEMLPEFRLFRLRPVATTAPKVSLVIKACAMDAPLLRDFVLHQVAQLAKPRSFAEVVVALDPFPGPYPRSWHHGSLRDVEDILRKLQSDRVVDRVMYGPLDGKGADLAKRWFGVDHDGAHVANGQPALGFLDAVEQCSGELILHVDADILVGRPQPNLDYVTEAAKIFADHPSAVTLALPVWGGHNDPLTAGTSAGPHRVEAMAGWLHRERLLGLRPLPNEVVQGRLALPWHRSLDVLARRGVCLSLRRGSPGLWFAGVDNARKPKVTDLLLILDRVEAGVAPLAQVGQPLVCGPLADWLGPVREEPVVVVVCGRNVAPGRIRRCLDSLTAQAGCDWGAVVIDDASDNGAADLVVSETARLQSRATVVRQRRRLGLLANTHLAIRHLIRHSDAVVVLLDLDDALGSSDALATVARMHRKGADVTVGSMVRTDKAASYPVQFEQPRQHRGGNVWQHLRTFRKSLFVRIAEADLQLAGNWVDLANDWAFMLPIVEMATNPKYIERPLYLHEPSTGRPAAERQQREDVVRRVVARPAYARGPSRHSHLSGLTTLCYHRIVRDVSEPLADLYARRGMAVSLAAFVQQMRSAMRWFRPVSLVQVLQALQGLAALPNRALLVTFDDGYRDFVELAAPVLARSGVPAVQFARVPQSDGLPTWAPLDLLRVVLAKANVPIDRALQEVGGERRSRLLEMPISLQFETIASIAAEYDIDLAAVPRQPMYATSAELRAVIPMGIALSGHGTEHVRWSTCSHDELRATLLATRTWLDELGQPPVLAWPDGDVNEQVSELAAAAGFQAGFALHEPTPGVASDFAIKRTLVQDDPDFVERLAETAEEGVQ
ncbi:MAG: glycosyltransferase [Deltaproteobacteria bacterium]|nr:glycosyltransferase [Deltaproteobacteria bacterium]